MLCPSCGEKTRVVETRTEDGQFRRRRECPGCGLRFNTFEITTDEFKSMRRATVPGAAAAATARYQHRIDRAVAILTEAEK